MGRGTCHIIIPIHHFAKYCEGGEARVTEVLDAARAGTCKEWPETAHFEEGHHHLYGAEHEEYGVSLPTLDTLFRCGALQASKEPGAEEALRKLSENGMLNKDFYLPDEKREWPAARVRAIATGGPLNRPVNAIAAE